jgi:hypothetical protein
LQNEDLDEENDEEAVQRRRDLIKMERRHREIQEDIQSKRREQLRHVKQEDVSL